MIQGYDPRTGKPAGEPVAETTDSAVDAIAETAAAARPGWEAMGPAGRAAALRAVAAALDAQAGELAALADTETALGSPRLTGEVARTTGQLRMFADVLEDGGYLDLITSPPAQGVPGLRRMVRPAGPVAVFSASNFPFAFSVAGGDTASALAAGCPVVVKAHEGHPQTSVATARIVAGALAGAGAPEGTFAVIYGVPAGVRLLRHPAITAAGFTGSARGGLALQQICAERDVPDPVLRRAGLGQPGRGPARRGRGPRGRDRHRLRRVAHPRGRAVLHQPRAAVHPRRRGRCAPPSPPRSRPPRAPRCCPSGSTRPTTTAAAALAAHPAVTPLATGQPGEGPWAATPQAYLTSLDAFAAGLPELAEERFGPAGLVITYPSVDALLPVLARLGGNLAGSIHADPGSAGDLSAAAAGGRRVQPAPRAG